MSKSKKQNTVNLEDFNISDAKKSDWSKIIQNYLFNNSYYDELRKQVLESDLPFEKQLELLAEIDKQEDRKCIRRGKCLIQLGIGFSVAKKICTDPNIIKYIKSVPKFAKLK